METNLKCTVEIFINNKWFKAATFEPYEREISAGTSGGGIFEYDIDYISYIYENELQNDPFYQVSPALPVEFNTMGMKSWPPFFLDLLPGGFARQQWENLLEIRNGPENDFLLLTKAAGNPIGNLRIREAVSRAATNKGKGFTESQIASNTEDFLNIANSSGALTGGNSSIQGEAPKYLMVKDKSGLFHFEGSLPEKDIAGYYIVKFPRGRKEIDELILKTEWLYYSIAEVSGLKIGKIPDFCDLNRGALFIPRFERVVEKGEIKRIGYFSLAAAAGITQFGEKIVHDKLLKAVNKYSTDRKKDICEYVKRDFLNIILGNTDNHARNSAFLIKNNQITLSPLFDVAPMYLDPEGIVRSTRWSFEEYGKVPEPLKVINYAAEHSGVDISEELNGFFSKFPGMILKMKELNIRNDIIERAEKKIEEIIS